MVKAQLHNCTIAPAGPEKFALEFMDALHAPAFRCPLPGSFHRQGRWQGFNLYLRGRWLRMPAHLLIPHLCRKAIKSATSKPES